MELIERYLSEVGRHLPPKSREDILAELRSLLQDKLDDRPAEGQPTKADVIAVLKEMGAPRKVAASYAGERHLIGPGLYPLFMRILRIGAMGLLIVPMLALWQMLAQPIPSFGAAVDMGVNAVWNYFNTLLHFFAILVLIFAALEWQEVRVTETEAAWDPQKLPPVDQAGRVDWFGMSIEMVFSFVGFGVFVYLYQQGGLRFTDLPGGMLVISQWLWIGLIMTTLLEICVRLVVLYQGAWRVPTAVISAVLELVSASFLLRVMQEIVAGIQPLLPSERIGAQLLRVPHIVFAVIVIIILIDSGVKLYRLINQRTAAAQAVPAASGLAAKR